MYFRIIYKNIIILICIIRIATADVRIKLIKIETGYKDLT
jgi:hypothetical protein